jgi:hypothetical protein
MPTNGNWKFHNYDDLKQQWEDGAFTCDDIADFTDPLVLDWCSRLEDWAPKVALCFNRNTSAVTLDRVSQHEMPELRRLVCYHQNCAVETLERLLNDFDKATVESAQEQLGKLVGGPSWSPSRPRSKSRRPRRRASARR